MQEIQLKNGYQHTQEPFDEEPGEMVDVWVLMPSTTQAQRPPSRMRDRLQQLRPNYLNRPTAQRGGG
jgi:hypothetical protein